MKKFIGAILICVMVVLMSSMADAVTPQQILTGTDQMLYEGYKNKTIAVGANYDSGIDYTASLSPTTGNKCIRFTTGDSTLTAGYLIKSVTIYTDQPITIQYRGTGINACSNVALGGPDAIKNSYLRAGCSVTWEFATQLDAIRLDNASGATAIVDVFVRTIKP